MGQVQTYYCCIHLPRWQIAIDITNEYINSLLPGDAYTVYFMHYAHSSRFVVFCCGLVLNSVTHIFEGYSSDIKDIMWLHELKLC